MLRSGQVLFAMLACFVWSCSYNLTIPGTNDNTSSSSSLEGVVCGESKCEKGQSCHYFSQNKPLCVGKEGVPKEIQEKDKGNASMACDGPEDCESGQECAFMIRATADYSSIVFCTDKRDISWPIVCHQATQCPSSHPVCKPYKTTYMGPFNICSKAS